MWTRKELKDKAKVAFRANYWKSVLVALVLVVGVGMGFSSPSAMGGATAAPSAPSATSSSYGNSNVNFEVKDGKVVVDVDDAGRGNGSVHIDLDSDELDSDSLEELTDALDNLTDDEPSGYVSVFGGPGMALFGVSMMLAVLVAIAIVVAMYVFVISPLEVGSQRFFLRNLNQPAEVKELAYGYDNNYKEVVKTMFLRSLFVFLWSLLLVIPGIYKAYEYRMIPYLMAEDPTMTKDRAFTESKNMMNGQKWNAFVLDLSFLGWNILSALTLGILGVFYVDPYQAQTNAALYEKLRYGLPAPEQASVNQPAYAAPAAAPVPPAGYANGNAYGNEQANAYGNAQPQAQTAPVIVPASQPPVPPFAAESAQPTASFADEAWQGGTEPVEAGNAAADAATADNAADVAMDADAEPVAAGDTTEDTAASDSPEA